jgi:hypothetical protein
LLKIDQPIELGQIHWLRDYDKALTRSEEKILPFYVFSRSAQPS